jgi:hypothetical protein
MSLSNLWETGSKVAKVPLTGVNTAAGIADVAFKTADKTASVVGNTTAVVADNVGKTANSATGIIADTLETFELLSDRIRNSTEEMAERRAAMERIKTEKQQGKTKEEIAQIEKDTAISLKKIDDEYNQQMLKMENEQEMLLKILNTKNQLAGLEQNENDEKMAECYYYGFKTDSIPYEPGKNKSSIFTMVNFYEKVMYYSYVPVSFVSVSGNFIVFEFPKKQLGEMRQQILEGIDKNTDKKIKLQFKLVQDIGWIVNSQHITPVVEFVDINEKHEGKLYFKKVWFYEKKYRTTGGRSRRRSLKSKRNKKRKTYKKPHRKSSKKYMKKNY